MPATTKKSQRFDRQLNETLGLEKLQQLTRSFQTVLSESIVDQYMG